MFEPARQSGVSSDVPATAQSRRPGRYLPVLAALMIVTIVAIVAGTLWRSREEALDAARVSTRNLARVLEEQTFRTLRAVDGALTGVATLWSAVAPSHRPAPRQMHELLRTKADVDAYIRSIYVLDRNGTIVHDSESLVPRALSFPDRDYFRIHRDGDVGMHVSPMMKGRLTGRWGMVLSRRLNDPDGQFAGVVAAALEPGQLEHDYAGLDVGSKGAVNLRDELGQLIIRVPRLEGRVGVRLPRTEELRRMMDASGQASGDWVSGVDGVRRLFTARMVQDTPLMVFVGLSMDEVLASWRRAAVVYATVAVLLSAVIVVLTRRLTRSMVAREGLMASLTHSEALVREHRDNLQSLVEVRTAELRRATEAAQAASHAKSEFLANISHELRTPMHAILSFAKFGGDKAEKGALSPEKIAQYFARIQQSGERLLRLLNDLLDLSKLEAGKMVYDMKPSDLRGLAEDIVVELSGVARDKGVQVELPDTAEATVATCDPARMGQVFRNLLSNAIKFTPPGRCVRMTLAPGESPGAAAGSLLISVIDEGTGIPEDELDAIFDKFVQSSKTKSGAGGTGLGLAICREIVNHHGGRIWAVNNTGVGATVHILLPRGAAVASQSRTEAAASVA